MASNNEIQSVLSSSDENTSSLQIIEISSEDEDDVSRQPQHSKFGSGENDHHRSSSTPGNEVIELTDSDPDDSSDLPNTLSPLVKGSRGKGSADPRLQTTSEKFMSLYVDTSDDGESDKDCILVLNDPPGSRRPIRRVPPVKTRDDKGNPLINSSKKDAIPAFSQAARKPSGKRAGNSVLKAKEQARRQKYATDLFTKLNKDVFGDRLPKDTTLEWSKRLLTTAGRARWHRSREGIHSTKIELASKILDSDERIQNTLSHEMCHLACWIIDNQPREGHGQLFKSWAKKVTHKYPDVRVSTRHSYEISYPYEWKCEKCSKIYGRYTKSIRPDECMCGACKGGRLILLFAEKKSTTPKVGRMAVAKPRDSPCSIIGSPTKKLPAVQQTPSTSAFDEGIPGLMNAFMGISIDAVEDQ